MEIVIHCEETDCIFNQKSSESITEITPSHNTQIIHPTNICTHPHPNIQRHSFGTNKEMNIKTICNSKSKNLTS